MQLTVNELFYSIQGESTHAGRACVFVRLTGCNLRCRYCDTRYAYHQGRDIPVAQVVAQLHEFNCKLAAITGGEPLLQAATPLLVEELLTAGYQVLVETNGSLNIDRVDRGCIRIMDVKCPSSGEQTSNDRANFGRLTAQDQVKFVVGDRCDFDFARATLADLPSHLPLNQILFAPQFGRLPPDRLARWMLDARIAARLQLQLHKLIWPDRDRGV
jgi:7-carboxy-7-deazaguanine synthase